MIALFYKSSKTFKVFIFSFCNRTHKEFGDPKAVEEFIPKLFQSHIFCAGTYVGKQGSCKGDSGGPLMIQDLESKRWVQIGTVAGSVGDCGDINLPGIDVRLNHPSVSNFIDSVIYPLKKQTKVFFKCSKTTNFLYFK